MDEDVVPWVVQQLEELAQLPEIGVGKYKVGMTFHRVLYLDR